VRFVASAAAEPTREKSQRTEPIDEQAEAPSSKYPPPQPRGKFEPPLKADQPAKTEIKLRDWGIEHNVRNNVLYWSLECMPFVRNTAIEPCFHGHVKALLDALKLDAGTAGRRFFDRMSESGNIAASDDAQYDFWLRYGWLACSFADADQWELWLGPGQPPPSHPGDEKGWWWDTRMQGSPFFCLNRPSAMPGTLESEQARKQKAQLPREASPDYEVTEEDLFGGSDGEEE